MTEVRPLICVPSPRDIPDFKEAIDKIECPKLFAKYYEEPKAYEILRDMFLSTDYTHMAIVPDDLIVSREDFGTLCFDLTEFDFPVLAGTCRLDYKSDVWITGKKLDQHERFTTADLFSGVPIKKVEFDGLACSLIRRDVVEQIEFTGQSRFDFEFAKKCMELDIPMHVDTRVVMTHLANRIGTYENWGVGINGPYIVYRNSS